jgi:hypothetical protein
VWIERLARMGCATKGLVYFIIGGLALKVAVGVGGKTTDSKGALYAIAAQPFGQGVLVVVAFGLFSYALWRILEAIINPGSQGKLLQDIVRRIAYGSSGLAYLGSAFGAAKLALGQGGGSDSSTSHWTGILMSQPLGRWLVGLLGIGFVGVGFYHLYRAYQHESRKYLDMYRVRQDRAEWFVHIGRAGVAARGAIFGLGGWFLLDAALEADPDEARGLDGILQALLGQPFGKVFLGIIALGLIAYSIHMLVQARYRQMKAAKHADRQTSKYQ